MKGDTIQAVIWLARRQAPFTTTTIAKKWGWPTRKARQLVASMRDHGQIKCVGQIGSAKLWEVR